MVVRSPTGISKRARAASNWLLQQATCDRCRVRSFDRPCRFGVSVAAIRSPSHGFVIDRIVWQRFCLASPRHLAFFADRLGGQVPPSPSLVALGEPCSPHLSFRSAADFALGIGRDPDTHDQLHRFQEYRVIRKRHPSSTMDLPIRRLDLTLEAPISQCRHAICNVFSPTRLTCSAQLIRGNNGFTLPPSSAASTRRSSA